jgi:hypothetical protein
MPAKSAARSGRASPGAVEKRRAARRFNELLLGGGPRAGDGRTERRRKRLLKELADGAARAGKHKLKPIDVLLRIKELLELGEPLASIRKACPPPRALPITPDLVDGVRRLHRAYGFPPEAYRFVGLDDAVLRQAGIAGPGGGRRARAGREEEAARPGVARVGARRGAA